MCHKGLHEGLAAGGFASGEDLIGKKTSEFGIRHDPLVRFLSRKTHHLESAGFQLPNECQRNSEPYDPREKTNECH